ncbi:MAG: hypothetical protein ACJA1B_001180 [Polaribacter sp.]|jgi:hypothetical protein
MNSKIIYFLLLLTFMNCKSIDVKEIEKQLVMPGYSSEKIKLKYSCKIISKNDFKIISVKIDKINKEFKDFRIIQLPDGRMKNSGDTLKPGEYYIELNISKNQIQKTSIDVFMIDVLLGDKRLELKGKTLLINDSLRR